MNELHHLLWLREKLTRRLLIALENTIPGSAARLIGSLANGGADEYSDIDMLWEVPDESFSSAIQGIYETLANVHPLESLRVAPDFQLSDRRRLLFAQFDGMPLFWRVDLDILATSLHSDLSYDRDNPYARGEHESLTHSALMNAVAAIKAILRCHDSEAQALLERGFRRVRLPVPPGPPLQLIPILAREIAEIDPERSELAARVCELYEAELIDNPPQAELTADCIA